MEEFRNYVEYVLRGIVNDPDKLEVDEIKETEVNFIITIRLPSSNVGQIVGTHGRIKQALGLVFLAASIPLTGKKRGAMIEFVENDR